MRNIKCADCEEYRNEWCEKMLDSPHPDMLRDCRYFHERDKDAVKVIRCKDCKWYEGDIMANPWGVCCQPSWVDGNSGHEVAERGWCYRAERREE